MQRAIDVVNWHAVQQMTVKGGRKRQSERKSDPPERNSVLAGRAVHAALEAEATCAR